MKTLILVSESVQGPKDQRLLEFAQWMGVQTKAIVIADSSAASQQLLFLLQNAECCVAMSIDTLIALHTASPDPAHLLVVLEEHCLDILIFGCNDSFQCGRTLAWLTRGGVRGLVSCQAIGDDGVTFHFPRDCRELSQQFAGLSFRARRSAPLSTFELDVTATNTKAILLSNDRPVFLRMSRASCQLFLLAGAEMPDISQPLSRNQSIDEYYDRIIPLLILFRYCFGKQMWHGPDRTARLIIDDPLLAKEYGFLDFGALLASMQHENYGTSIAFIPWNYRRTSRKTAATLLCHEANLSVCVHGCDHTNKEFDSLDEEGLRRKACLALDRMEKHQQRTRLPFERVMVFPQGRFSTASLMALRASNYLAAVNSTCFPTNDGQDPLIIADFLRPAVTRFHGFPVFLRRYPERLIDFAFDLFIGRPALLVEHHQYFREGCGKLEEFVGELRKLEPRLKWPTLSAQLARNCMMRYISDDLAEVQFFTRRFELRNTRTSNCRFILEKYEPDSSVICAVLVDGRAVPFRFKEDHIQLEVEIGPDQRMEIEILDQPGSWMPATRSSLRYTAKVLLRRCLSEFRDNTLARHPGLLRIATGVVRRLKVTGDRTSDGQRASNDRD